MGNSNSDDSTVYQYSHIRGFNYQPSYGSSAIELWQNFDAERIRYEFRRAKEIFPWMNGVRFWLDWNSYLRNPEQFLKNFDKALEIFADCGCQTMPVLFNRWHSMVQDYGGIYLDHFMPRRDPKGLFDDYVNDIVGKHASDDRILMWDLCNEPQIILLEQDWQQGEFDWLKLMSELTRSNKPSQPICIGTHGIPAVPMVELFEPLVDVLITHPYFGWEEGDGGKMDRAFKELIDYAVKVNKPVLSTETCWGGLDDKVRARCIEGTLAMHEKYKIGWLVYGLWTSCIADLHGPELGPVGHPGNLAFILPDGSLRSHHEVIHRFA